MKKLTSIYSVDHLLAVFLGALLVSFPWLDRAFYTRGEPREALVAQAMYFTGNWISPAAYDGAVPSKPPFSHWLMTLVSYVVGDVTEFSTRLPTAIAFVVFMVAFYRFTAERSSASRALAASVILLSAPDWARTAVTCRVDMLLATTMCGGMLALFEWGRSKRIGYLVVVWLCLGAAILTKGPVGFVLPLGAYYLWRLLTDGLSMRTLLVLVGHSVVIAVPVVGVALSWYVAGYLSRGQEFLDMVVYENVQRFWGTMDDEPHTHSVMYILGAYLIGFAPWTIAWVLELWARRSEARNPIQRMKEWWANSDDFGRYALVVVVAVTIFFSIPSSKRSVYLLPAYPFVAFLVAGVIDSGAALTRRAANILTRIIVSGGVVIAGVGILGLVVGLIEITPEKLTPVHQSFLQSVTWWRVLGVITLLGAWLGVMRRLVGDSVTLRLARAFMLALVVANLFIVGPVAEELSPKHRLRNPAIGYALDRHPKESLLSYPSAMYALSFYLRRPFFRLMCPEESGLVFVHRLQIPELIALRGTPVYELASLRTVLEDEGREMVLVEAPPLSPSVAPTECSPIRGRPGV